MVSCDKRWRIRVQTLFVGVVICQWWTIHGGLFKRRFFLSPGIKNRALVILLMFLWHPWYPFNPLWGHCQEYKVEKNAIQQERLSSEKKEALLPITTLPCLKAFVSLITKNKSKSLWHTEKFAKSRLKEKSSRRMRTWRPNHKACCFLRCISSSPGHWQTSKLPQQGRVLSDRKIDVQTTLSSKSQLESSAGNRSLPG